MNKMTNNVGKSVKNEEIILSVRDLKKWFPIAKKKFGEKTQHVKAVDGVSFDIKYGETLGVVGESGCGKTTLGRSILRLIEPTSGEVYFEGQNLVELNKEEMRKKRSDLQIMFQDPYGSLNPRMTVGDIIAEPLDIQTDLSKEEKIKRVVELMKTCGLDPIYIRRYPHEFSGGQRQRIGIARSLALTPKLIVCDEPVSALDVSIQSQIINLLMDLQDKYGLTYIFISHDLSVIYHMVDRVAVMYLGRLMEVADKEDLYNNPLHPYTKALIQAVPTLDYEHKNKKTILKGDIPSPVNPPSGCVFHTRCPECKDICSKKVPELREVVSGRTVACHFAENFIK